MHNEVRDYVFFIFICISAFKDGCLLFCVCFRNEELGCVIFLSLTAYYIQRVRKINMDDPF